MALWGLRVLYSMYTLSATYLAKEPPQQLLAHSAAIGPSGISVVISQILRGFSFSDAFQFVCL